MAFNLPIERLFDGRPLISPKGDSWESGVTFNSAAVHLPLTPANLPAIQALLGPDEEPREIVALHYRARPADDPGFPNTRSYVGLSVHEPDLTPIRRFEGPVLEPGSAGEFDALGSEDPRVTFLDGTWWMVYCGVSPGPKSRKWLGSVCVAQSDDLVEWQKCGIAKGLAGISEKPVGNKDGVLFPDRIGGMAVMLHRPMAGSIDTWKTCLAIGESPSGPFKDLGPVHGPERSEGCLKSWSGAGAVPIKIAPGRYVSIEHTGNYLKGKRRKYVLDAYLYDFSQWDAAKPETLLVARMDDIMRPETDFELKGPFAESVSNVVFSCGAYVHDGWLYIVYGGGDSYILGARMRFDVLVDALESQVWEAASA